MSLLATCSFCMFLCLILNDGSSVVAVPVDNSAILDNFAGPVMVPVSSTVIPILHLFGRPKPLQAINQKQSVGRSSAAYLSPERTARLFERSKRPDTPVRLITKKTR